MAYVYRHIRLDKNEPFYIGICKDDGFNYKRAKSKQRNNIWKKIAAKTDYEVEILFSNVNIDFAKKKEIEFISLYGRISCGNGILANISGGGEPLYDPPEYLRNQLRENSTGEKNHFFGKKHTQETRKKISEMQIGKKRGPLAEQTKIKIGLANKGRLPWITGKKVPHFGVKKSGINHFTYKGHILCYDLSMNLVNEFVSIKEAANYFNSSNTNYVRRVIVGERKHWKNHIFKYKSN
jgi:hypothetical protein